MNVKASPGLQCPMENKPREYITDDEQGVDVPSTAYYRRLVDDGSLINLDMEADSSQIGTELNAVSRKNKGGDR